MKCYILAILLLSLVCIDAAKNSLKDKDTRVKKSKSKKVKVKGNGSGSWDTGYNCEGGITVGGVREGEGTFYAKNMENPTSDADKQGMCFKMPEAPTGTLRNLMIQVGSTNNWCLPCRYMITEMTYFNPFVTFKYLFADFQSDNMSEAKEVRILLPYAYTSWYIDNEEMTKISGFMNKCKQVNQDAIKDEKSQILEAASKYIGNQPLYEASLKTGFNLKAEKQKLEDELSTLEATATTNESDLASATLASDAAAHNTQVQQDKVNKLQQEISNLQGNSAKVAKSIEKYRNDDSISSEKKNKLIQKSSVYLSTFLNGINTLKGEVPQKTFELEEAVHFNANSNSQGVHSDINKINVPK